MLKKHIELSNHISSSCSFKSFSENSWLTKKNFKTEISLIVSYTENLTGPVCVYHKSLHHHKSMSWPTQTALCTEVCTIHRVWLFWMIHKSHITIWSPKYWADRGQQEQVMENIFKNLMFNNSRPIRSSVVICSSVASLGAF